MTRYLGMLAAIFYAVHACGCAYLADRGRDFADIFHGEFHLGFGIHANAQVTRFAGGGLGFRATEAYGFVGRMAGSWEEHRFDCSAPVPYIGPRICFGWSERENWTGTVEQASPDYFSDTVSDYHPLADANRRLGDIGGGFCALFFGLDFSVSLFELADFITGLAGIDIMDDDDAWVFRDFNAESADARLDAYRKFFSRGRKTGDSWIPTEYEKKRLDSEGIAYPEKLVSKMLNDSDERIVRLCAEIMPLPDGDDFSFAGLAKRLGGKVPEGWASAELERLLAQNRDSQSAPEIDEIITLLGDRLPPGPFIRYRYPGAAKHLTAGIKTVKTPEELALYLEALNFQKDRSVIDELVSLLGKAGQPAKPHILFSLLKHEAYGPKEVYTRYVKTRNNNDPASWYAIELLARGGDNSIINRLQNAARKKGAWLEQKMATVILRRMEISVDNLLQYRTE